MQGVKVWYQVGDRKYESRALGVVGFPVPVQARSGLVAPGSASQGIGIGVCINVLVPVVDHEGRIFAAVLPLEEVEIVGAQSRPADASRVVVAYTDFFV